MSVYNLDIKTLKSSCNNIPLPSEAFPCHSEPSEDKLVSEILLEMARANPNDIAIESDTVSLSYHDLNHAVTDFAIVLLQEGVKKNSTVFIYASRTPLLVISILATLKVGATFSLLDPSDPVEYLESCIKQAKPSVWIDLSHEACTINKEKKLEIDLLIKRVFKLTFNLNSITDIANLVQLHHVAKENAIFPKISGDDTATITFTSGSNGTPKAVMGRHSSLSHFQGWMQKEFGINGSDRFAMCSNLSHDPIQRDIFTAICLGGTIVIPSQQAIFTPGQLPQWMAHKKITVCCLTPPMCQFLTLYNSENIKLNTLRKIFFVGTSLLKKQVEDLQYIAPYVDVINLYGSTETQRAVSYFNVTQNLQKIPSVVPIGKGMKDVDILIVNQATKKLCDVGEVGEIWVRSPYIAKGYLNAPGNDAFSTNPFSQLKDDFIYKTGDLGVYSSDFGAQCLGRVDSQIKIDGHRVELSHIDNILIQFNKIKDAVTLAIFTQRKEHVLIAFLVANISGGETDNEKFKKEARHFLEKHLPKYMIPRVFIIKDKIPLTKNGKVDYKLLKSNAHDYVGRNKVLHQTKASTISESIISMVSDILSIPIHLIDNKTTLNQLGFTSLNYIEFLNRIRKKYNINLTYNSKMPTILEIINSIDQVNNSNTNYAFVVANGDVHAGKILKNKHIEYISSTKIKIDKKIIDHFCSNSYLGLGRHSIVRQAVLDHLDQDCSINSHGAMELNGKTCFHVDLINEIKQLYNCNEVLLYNSAYMANISIIPTLANSHDHIFIDSACHQSIIDGCSLSHAHFHSFKHNDMTHLEKKLHRLRNATGKKIIITEGLYSMEGTILALPEIKFLVDKYQALLMVDEACSLGQLGANGAGVESYFNMPGTIDIRIGTLSKAIPSIGGYIATNKAIFENVQMKGGSIFSGAIPPIQARIAAYAFKVIKNTPSLFENLRANTVMWRDGLEKLGFDIIKSESAITAIKTRDDDHTKQLYERFYNAGVYVFPALPPWNAKNKSLIRTSVTAMHTQDQIEKALDRIANGNEI